MQMATAEIMRLASAYLSSLSMSQRAVSLLLNQNMHRTHLSRYYKSANHSLGSPSYLERQTAYNQSTMQSQTSWDTITWTHSDVQLCTARRSRAKDCWRKVSRGSEQVLSSTHTQQNAPCSAALASASNATAAKHRGKA